MVETEVDHVKNAMSSQSCCQSFVQSSQPKAMLMNDFTSCSKSGFLLESEVTAVAVVVLVVVVMAVHCSALN